MYNLIPIVLLCFSIGTFAGHWPRNTHAPTVKIGHTSVVGRAIPELQQEFFGAIPFAEPPTGHHRLKPPILKTKYHEATLNATDFGPQCLQPGVPIGPTSEDCLTINILRPAGLPHNAKLPVMFWTYGGAFTNSGASIFNASTIVAQSAIRGTPVIYVNFNYRAGPLGFPQGQEAGDKGALNLAIRDELAALKWVQHNIHVFGGDRHKVTIFANSAGSIMTSILFLHPHIDRYARAGIFESGHAASSVSFEAKGREQNWVDFVKAVKGCEHVAESRHTFDCLQQAKEEDILQGINIVFANAKELIPFKPNVDGSHGLLPDLPSNLFHRGRFSRLPFIAGTNLDEGTAFVPPTLAVEDDIRASFIFNFTPPFRNVMQDELVSAVEGVLELYPDDPALGSPFGTGQETFGLSPEFKRASAIQGDVSFTSQRRFWSQETSRAGVKNWAYLFTEPQPQLNPFLGVSHGSEVFFVYGALQSPLETAKILSPIMIDYWVSFATSLTPNDGLGLPRPTWEQFEPHKQQVLELNGANIRMIPDDFRREQNEFFDSFPLVFYR